MKKILLGLISLSTISTFAANKCDVFVPELSTKRWGGNYDHMIIKEELREEFINKLHAQGYNIVFDIEEANIIFENISTGCAQGIGMMNTKCVRAYGMIDYTFSDNSKAKKLKKSKVWKKNGRVSRRAFSASDSSFMGLFSEASQRKAGLRAIEKISECKY